MIYLILWIASWGSFFAGAMWLALGTPRLHPDTGLLIRAVLTLLLIAGGIFMTLTAHNWEGLK